MQRYIVSRILQMLVALLVLSLAVFLIVRASGDPLHLMMPPEATKEDYERVRHSLGLDRPVPVQYVMYVGKVARGDLGTSLRSRIPVNKLVAERLPNSLKLAIVSMGFATLVAVPLGVVAAARKGTGADVVAKVIALLGQSVPGFWLGIVLMIIFAVRLHWLPTSGVGGPLHYIMPAFTLGSFITAGMMRLVRSSMLEVLDSEYVKLARIKGVSERRVIWVHALRNGLIPLITFAAVYFALFIGAAVVVETIFNWPGMGSLAYSALLWRDLPVLQGVVLTVGAIVLVLNLAVDILYAYIDPRIRY